MEKRENVRQRKSRIDFLKTDMRRADDECWVTTGRRGHSRHSYLERPRHICWWRTWSWGWGCCRPRCGTWRASPRSGVPGSPRCSGRCSGMESEPRRCRGDTGGWRTACTRTPCPGSSLWSCGPEGTCAERRDRRVKQRQEALGKAAGWKERRALQSCDA